MALNNAPSSLKFGTSGLRGLVVDLVGAPARDWTRAFLAHVGTVCPDRTLLVGRDLRSSSPAIAADCIAAARDAGWRVFDCGDLPTPALAQEALRRAAAAIMVTGSHIPDDRNGLKFYRPDGEIGKSDEAAIRAAFEQGAQPSIGPHAAEPVIDIRAAVLEAYRRRYADFFGPTFLSGLTIGVYQHSSVARDLLVEIVEALGATAIAFGRASSFVPVDTEAHRPEDVALIAATAASHPLDAIVSTDGDADRPLVADARGVISRGDMLGLLTSRELGLATIVTPVTSSAAMETSGVAAKVTRTRVGSPFVIAGMQAEQGSGGVLGFEANGGVLTGSEVERDGRTLAALPTRDAVLPIICALAAAARPGGLAGALASLGGGHALADRLQEVPAARSGPFLQKLATSEPYCAELFAAHGGYAERSTLDGVRFLLTDGSVVHFRASGNAPELRVYVEAAEAGQARALLDWGLAQAARAVAA